MKEKILILGCSGFVGHALMEHFTRSKEDDVAGTFLTHKPESKKGAWEKIDVCIPQQLTDLLKKFKPTVIVNTVAIGNVEPCEKDKALCSKINISPTQEIVQYCKSHPETKYVFFSSDHVFQGGMQRPYQETDAMNPINYYGQTKLRCEELITSALPNYAIIRPCFIFGLPQPHHHSNLFFTIYNHLKQHSKFNAYIDKIRSPCYVKDLPLVIEEIIRKHKKGTFHAGGVPITVYHFGREIAKYFQFNEKLVIGIPSNEQEFPPRPRNCALDNSHTEKELGIRFRTLEEAFRDIKKELSREGLWC